MNRHSVFFKAITERKGKSTKNLQKQRILKEKKICNQKSQIQNPKLKWRREQESNLHILTDDGFQDRCTTIMRSLRMRDELKISRKIGFLTTLKSEHRTSCSLNFHQRTLNCRFECGK